MFCSFSIAVYIILGNVYLYLLIQCFHCAKKDKVLQACPACCSLDMTVQKEGLAKLEGNDMMVQWMCKVTLKGRQCPYELGDCMGLVCIRNCIQSGRQ